MFESLMILSSLSQKTNVILFVMFILAFDERVFPKNIVAIDVPELDYVAAHLKPEECSKIVSYGSKPAVHGIEISKSLDERECLLRLVNWASELKVTRRDVQLVLENRLRQIGRDDLATRVVNPSTIAGSLGEKSFRDESANWDAYPVARGYGNMESLSESDDKNKDQNQASTVSKVQRTSNYSSTKEVQENGGKQDALHRRNISQLIEKDCIRVPMIPALAIIGCLIFLTCCCALLVRNRLAACFHRLRGKKKKNKKGSSRRFSGDEERGRITPRRRKSSSSHKATAKRVQRIPSNGLIHAGTQNSSSMQNEEEEKPTGCCTCCRKKKRRKSGKRRRQ